VNQEQPSAGQSPGGIDLRMTLVSQKLKAAGYVDDKQMITITPFHTDSRPRTPIVRSCVGQRVGGCGSTRIINLSWVEGQRH